MRSSEGKSFALHFLPPLRPGTEKYLLNLLKQLVLSVKVSSKPKCEGQDSDPTRSHTHWIPELEVGLETYSRVSL